MAGSPCGTHVNTKQLVAQAEVSPSVYWSRCTLLSLQRLPHARLLSFPPRVIIRPASSSLNAVIDMHLRSLCSEVWGEFSLHTNSRKLQRSITGKVNVWRSGAHGDGRRDVWPLTSTLRVNQEAWRRRRKTGWRLWLFFTSFQRLTRNLLLTLTAVCHQNLSFLKLWRCFVLSFAGKESHSDLFLIIFSVFPEGLFILIMLGFYLAKITKSMFF